MTEKQIEGLIRTLSKKQLMQFGISCVERNIHLYKKMEDNEGKLPKSKNYEVIVSIVDFIKNEIDAADKTQIKAQLKKCERIGDYLSDELDEFAMVCFVGMIENILSFHLKEDVENIVSCVENCLEIINQVKSDEYCTTINPDADDKELRKYLDAYFEQELKLEYDIIEQIKKNIPASESDFIKPKQSSKAMSKKSEEQVAVKKLKAKDFMLNFDAVSKRLKIGFGEYFYNQKGQIKISKEFTPVNLTKIENLQINEEKRTVEFDAFFKKAQTHFIIKEVYAGTLGIMNFIQSYNENPFEINPEYKDEISVVIDKDGFNLSLSRPNCEKSVILFNTKKGVSFKVYFPGPAMRFDVQTYEIDDNVLSIKHDMTDLYSNKTVDNTEYYWAFDIQPEMKELIIRFIKVAIKK